MRKHSGAYFAAAILFGGLSTQPAQAVRTAIDAGATFHLSGYCSPNTEASGGCTPYTLTNPLNIGGTAYQSFYVNSNGTVTLGSIQSYLTPQIDGDATTTQTQLSAYAPIPVFSPKFLDGPGAQDIFGDDTYDGTYVSDTTISGSGFSVNFYACSTPLFCGTQTVNLVQNATFSQQSYDQFKLSREIANASQLPDPSAATPQQNFDSGKAYLLANYPTQLRIYTMTLTQLAVGFQVDYLYNPAAAAVTGTYGFNLPTAQLQATGPLQNRTFLFDVNGALIGAVPEPATWLTMLLGFALIGTAVRRQRRRLIRV